MEGASPPKIINWMHADLQIEFENGISLMIEKSPLACPGQYFSSKKVTIVLLVPSEAPSISSTMMYNLY